MSIPDVRAEVHVAAEPADAFHAFVHGIDRWWPKANTFGEQDAEEVAIRPEPGEPWYERARDGTRTPWGEVVEVEANRRIVLTWGISPDRVPWRPEPNPDRRSTVTITFEPTEPGGTRVALRHEHIARHGERARDMADAMGSEHGWPNLLNAFKRTCEAGVP